ncbi:MAG: cytochrome c family protein [Paracoccus sp. (in: a-proteobacteria)]|nr:cytochrome c family protein [Paracoccus sp. (in: a-proteobacteria)]
MFNTMTITKAAGAVIGALLFLMLAQWAASGLYHVGPSGHAAEGELNQAYIIPVESADAAPAEEEAPVDFAEVMATADAGRGERAFAKCRSCHALDGRDGVGPHLNGVVDRDKASVAGYAYSQAAEDMPGVWTAENLSDFIANPRGYMPGTKMTFAGINSVQERADLIAYLATTN